MKKEIVKAELLDWEGETVEVITEPDGSLWFTAEYIGRKLGYSDPGTDINKLFKRHKDEFTNDDAKKAISPYSKNNHKTTFFSIDGTNLLLMFSRKPEAKQFRAWLKKVATQIKTQGYYIEDTTKLIEGQARIIELLEAHEERLSALERTRETATSAIEKERASRLTATEYAKTNLNPPKHFNRFGHFDNWMAVQHYRRYGEPPDKRIALVGKNKKEEYVYPKTVETYEFLSKQYKVYMKYVWSRQQSLKLVYRETNY